MLSYKTTMVLETNDTVLVNVPITPVSEEEEKMSLMMGAIRDDDLTVVANLLDSGFDVNKVDQRNTGYTPFLLTVVCGRFSILSYLYSRGADIETTNPENDTPLLLAIRCSNPSIVAFLLFNGADRNFKDMFGFTPLLVAQDLHPSHEKDDILFLFEQYPAE